MILTIENDPVSPFGEPEVPAAEWTFRDWRTEALSKGVGFLRAYLSQASRAAGRTIDGIPDFPTGQSLATRVHAYVNHSRWLWDCPVCGGAQVCSDTDRRAFCIDCFNAGDGWWPVDWPDADIRAAAETVLSARLNDSERNWRPADESVHDLQLENLAHGVNPDAPDHVIVGDPQVMLGLRNRLRELDYPIIDDGRLILPSSPLQRALWVDAPLTIADADAALAEPVPED